MASLRVAVLLVTTFLCGFLVTLSQGMYADQAGVVDWCVPLF